MDDQIAIIGIGCRFPGGADSPRAFWRLLEQGVNAVTEAPADRAGFTDCFDADPGKPGRAYSRWGGFLDRVDLFDAQFFGISPREAAHIDPQHRLLLELVWEACEDGGVPPTTLAGSRTGVFVGISTHDYGDLQMYPSHRGDIDMHTNSGTATSIAANRLSYVYDLRGPSVAVDTACSSSLTAVHFACQSLRVGECEVAFAGGVQILLTPELTIGFCKASMLSPDGECRAFDADANGYVRGEGAGVIMLKPLAAARRDGDPIHAVIRATAINQDGRTHGMTVPSPRAQQAMIEDALRKAGLTPREVQYVEAHGPGTRVGDPIEAAAISAALRPGRPDGEPCLIGSVKTNLGHLEAASGMPGLIKVALSLRHRKIPPSLHFHRPNEAIDLQALGLRVVTELEPWPQPHQPAIAGVNSFGFGGANAHVLLQEPPARPEAAEAAEAPERETARLLVLSARSADALKDLAAACAQRLGEADAPRLRDLCFTSAERRAHHDLRLAVVASRPHDFATLLRDFADGGSGAGLASGRAAHAGPPPIAFVCSGMGPQWWGMGRQLRESEPVFRQMLERCDAALRPLADWSLLDELAASEGTSRVADPALAQVTNFAIQVALADLWASWGITPSAVIGHSGGAMAAAYIAGVYDLDEAMRLSFHRSRLQGRPANAGRMLAVGAPYDEIAPLLAGTEHLISLAAVNGPAAITLAGDDDTIERIAAALLARQIFARVLAVTIAYHSPAMDPIKEEFLAAVAGLRGRPTRIPWLSDTTGTWADGESCDADYWWRAIRQPVRFRDGIRQILDAGITHFVEIAPHPVLASSVMDCLKEHGTKGVALPSLRRTDDEATTMRRSLGALYAAGCAPAWPALREDGARLAALPPYPWQRERHWFEPRTASDLSTGSRVAQAGDHPLLGARAPSARPAWDTLAGTGATAFLREHVVQGAAVCPGAAYVEMALAARTALDGDTPMLMRDVEFTRALRLTGDDGTQLQCTLDAVDGRVEIFSTRGGASPSWTRHATGVITPTRRAEAPRVDLEALRARCAVETSADAFYARMAERGLAYGPSFRAIQRLWSGQHEALAGIAAQGKPHVAAYRAHPALLDAAFQVLVCAAESHPGMAAGRQLFLPTKIRELRWHGDPGSTFWVTAAVREVTNASVTGDLRIIADDGRLCADVFGFTARLIEVAADRNQESVDQWLYDYRWEPLPRQMPGDTTAAFGTAQPVSVLGPLPAGPTLDAIRRRATSSASATGWRAYYDHVEARLNEISAAYITEAFAELGCVLQPGARLSPGALGAAATLGWRRSLAEQLFRQLSIAGIVRSLGDAWAPTGVTPRATAAELSEQLRRECPAHRLDVELLSRAGPRLSEVLAGRADGRDVLFTDDGYRFLEQFYRESPASAFYNAQVAEVVGDLCAHASPDRPLRILEVGAGTGGTTSLVLPRLAASGARYLFTDVSPLFLERAREKFRGHPGLATAIFDVTADPAGQGLEPGAFDLVIAANVLHATPDVAAAAQRLRTLLAPGGVLLLLEITRHPHWLDIVFGLMDGWWALEDRRRRPTHPLMRGSEWRALLDECGFVSAAVIADEVEGEPAQSLVVAHRPIEVEVPAGASAAAADTAASAAHWIVFADATRDVAQRLAAHLRARGDACSLYAPGTSIAQVVHDLPAHMDRLAGVVHLSAVDAPAMDGLATFTQAQTGGCGRLLDILQGVVLGTPLAQRRLVVVTAGAQMTPHDASPPALLQTPLWGFGRTVRKELPALRCGLIDLSVACLDVEIAALADELRPAASAPTAGTDEDEIALRGTERYVHRLRPISRARIADAAPLVPAAAGDGWCAEVASVGSLDSIALRRCDRRAPGPHEVEVAIEAASLNFRDVVVATGVVQGLEADNTFGSRQLGIDMAGTVTRCGEAVVHLKPGDAVLGIAQAAFASYAVTDAALVVRRPARLSAEDGSTVPVAFVTVWYALGRLARLAKGEAILVHAASGGVGLAAMQIAKRAGARIFATAGSPAKRAFLEALGAEAVMDSRSLDFAEEVRDRTGGRGVDVVLNSLPGEAIARGIGALAPYGRFVELGKADIYQNHRIELGPFRKNLSLFAVDLDRMCVDRPALVGEMLQEVTDAFASGELQAPPRTDFPMARLVDAMRYLAQARHIGKVVVTASPNIPVRAALPTHPPVRANATYLITGGHGGLGLVVARWLVDRGARSVVLVGRTPPSPDAVATMAELRARGARVESVAADVSASDEVRRVLAFVRANLPPLGGILHAAMVLDDTPIAVLDRAGLDRVMAPKVLGAWHLHHHTLGDALDFFVCFSSITSLLGNPLQANYAAANAFLDAFAAHRRQLGLPATTINWGVIAGAGYVARHHEVEGYLNKQGYLSFTLDQTIDVLSELLRLDASQVMAARIDWKRFAEYSPRAAASPQLRHLVPADAESTDAPSPRGSLRARLASEGSSVRVASLEQYLRDQMARLLGAAPASIDIERPIPDLGLDSLIAVELTLALDRDLGIEMAGTKLLGGASIRQLAVETLGLLHLAPADAAHATVEATSLATIAAPPETTADILAETLAEIPAEAAAEAAAAATEHAPPRRDVTATAAVDYASLDYTTWTPAQRAIKAVTAVGFSCLARIDSDGLEHIPREGPCLLAVNHLSMADVPLLLTLLQRRAIILAVDQLQQFRILDWFVSDMGQAIYVERNQAEDGSLTQALAVLAAGGLLALAPEGRRSTSGLLRARTGVAYLATQADVPIVPLVAWGQERWRTRWTRVTRIPIHVRAGEPMRFPAGPASPAQLRAYTDTLMQRMASLLPAEYRGVYGSPS